MTSEGGQLCARGVDRRRAPAAGKAFTLVELLVVISIVSVLMAVLVPAVGLVKEKARAIVGMNNQKQIAGAVNVFAADNDERYPDSVATVGYGEDWNWSDPTKMAGNRRRSPRIHRSMSQYLRPYIADASTMFCPSAPQQYTYLQQAWDAGEEWDNPETAFPADPFGGTYCFYWNYVGYLGGRRGVFRGPRGPASSGLYSKLLVSDYYGYDHWRSPGAYGSCERFDKAELVPETYLLSAYWSQQADPNDSMPNVKLQAAYTDGHVETYWPNETVPMKVSITSDGAEPYPDGVGPGTFCLPPAALH